MNPLNFAHPPGAFSGTAGGKSIFAGNTPFQKLPHSGSTVLPMLPDQRPKTASDPVRQRAQSVEGLGYPVIIPPMTNLKMNLRDVPKELSARDFYGKVIEHIMKNRQTGVVRFTSVPPEVSGYFQALMQTAAKPSRRESS